MDAETKEQLKTNDLATQLVRLEHAVEKYWFPVVLVVLVVFGGFLLVRFYRAQQIAAEEARWGSLVAIDTQDQTLGDAPLDTVRKLIAENTDANFLAQARMRLAAGLIDRGLESRDLKRFDEAEQLLRAVADDSQVAVSTQAAATYQLAAVYESKREFDKAKAEYQKLATDAKFANNPFKNLAEMQVEMLPKLGTPVAMTPGSPPPPPTEPTASAPASAEAATSAPTATAPANAAPATNAAPAAEAAPAAATQPVTPAQP